MERLGRLCVGVGPALGRGDRRVLADGWADRPEEWAPYLDRAISSDLRQFLYFALTYVVTPIGMLMLLRDMFGDPGPLWLKLAAPGVFASVYALLLAAATPEVGQPILVWADPIVAQIFPGMALGPRAADSLTWMARFGGLLLILGGVPGALGMVVGLLTGGSKER